MIAPESDARINVIENTLKMAQTQERALRLRLHRINLQAAGLEVKAPPKMTSLNDYDLDVGQQMAKYYNGGGKKNASMGGMGSNMV